VASATYRHPQNHARDGRGDRPCDDETYDAHGRTIVPGATPLAGPERRAV
jgi:hypothetical protein